MRAGVFLALLCVSCGPVGYGMPSTGKALAPVGDEATALVARVVSAVNEAAGGEMLWIVSGASAGTTVPVPVELCGPICGSYYKGRITVSTEPECNKSDDMTAVLLVHEIGHAFGLENSVDPSSVMFEHASRTTTLSAAADSLVYELSRTTLTILPPNDGAGN